LRLNAQIAATMGIEPFVVDLGWVRELGDWREDPQKFPSGLRALSDYVHSLGMKFGLHFAFAEAMADPPSCKRIPIGRLR
jgi:alpha-galactosidase